MAAAKVTFMRKRKAEGARVRTLFVGDLLLLTPARFPDSRVQILKGFLEASSGEKVFEVCVDFVAMSLVPGGDFVTNLSELFEMSRGVAIAGLVIGDDGKAFFKNLSEFGVIHTMVGCSGLE